MTACALNTGIITYPSVIARACAALDESAAFRDMPDGYFRIVVRIIKKINLQNLTAPIFASRGTLASESGKSLETVHRAIKWLETHGLILREQTACAGLRGSFSPLVPTIALLESIQLKGNPKQHEQPAQNNEEAPTDPSHVKPDSSISIKKKTTIPTGEQSKEPEILDKFIRIEGFAIPEELAWLCRQQKMKATALLSLMKHAKKHKQRLADCVTSVRKYLENIKGRKLYAYLLKVINSGKDFRIIAQEEVRDAKAKQVKNRLEQKAFDLAGRSFRSKDGSIFVHVEQNGILSEVRNGRRASGPITEAFLDALEDGRLLPN